MLKHIATAQHTQLPGGCTEIWFVILFLTHFKALNILLLTHFLNRDILLNASAILLVSSSAAGADKLDEPKLDKSKAKKRLRTCNGKALHVIID